LPVSELLLADIIFCSTMREIFRAGQSGKMDGVLTTCETLRHFFSQISSGSSPFADVCLEDALSTLTLVAARLSLGRQLNSQRCNDDYEKR